MKKINKWMMLSAAVLMLVSGCSKSNDEAEPGNGNNQAPVEQPSKENEGQETAAESPYAFPLTGIGTEKEAAGRAVAVMINNHPAARPQSGLPEADIVYELLAEGDVTRFLAIYQSEQPEKIGPVRSARDYYIELAKAYDGLYVCHGNSPDAKELMDNGYIDHLNGLYYDGTLFQRAGFRKAPHNSYTSYENILKGAAEKDYEMEEAPGPLSFMTAEEAGQLTGEEAESATVTYLSNETFSSTYEYDRNLDKYKRSSNGELTADYDSGAPVLIDNIFIIEASHKIVDSAGRREINLTSGGRGYLLQKGLLREVEWKNEKGRLLPYIDGKEAPLVRGKTWINVVPSDPGLGQAVSLNQAN